MAFINMRLPEEIEIGCVARDVEDIEIVETDGGFEQRNAHTDASLLEYEGSFPTSGRGAANFNAVIDLYKVARGMLHYFLFRDWRPQYSELVLEEIGTGDGAQTLFQITKTHSVAGFDYVRTVTRPAAPIAVYLDAELQGAGYEIDYETGELEFDEAPEPGVAVKVSGKFDIPVRFDSPLETTGIMSELEHIETITLKEVRE